MDLANYGWQLAQATGDAVKWVERNSDLARNEKEGLLKELRAACRTFRACAKSASKRMSAGVFGPSQAGKSYLISALAAGRSRELIALFAGEERDFIREINPAGGKESTGLVTRFTLSQPPALPAGYPVVTRLLTEMDLVKILANTWYEDCVHSEDPRSHVEKTLSHLKSLAKDSIKGMDLDSLEDLREYLLTNFKGNARIQELEREYWEDALELGQRLDLEGRISLYSLIWDENPEFTALLRNLLTALERLGFPEDLFCSLDALIPRDKSIIDVTALRRSGKEDDDDIAVCTPAGVKTLLRRSVVTAIAAELVIYMRDKPTEYFNHTDLLDFPGYRSRYQLDDIHKTLKKYPDVITELFLRGKVAYLFQRYCAERELNNMLLCIGPSNQEVQDLPGVINDWVAVTHGSTAVQRQNKLVSLFFILTKFDVEFEDKKGAPFLRSRWDVRLHASLLDFFGKNADWPTQWTPGQPFNNMFLLRNPNCKFDSVLTYVDNEETGVRTDKEKFVEELHAAFTRSPLVARHFQNVEKSWNEGMRLNDGGISHIRESLSVMCDPAIKERQLLENINFVRGRVERRLKPFYRTDDREELRKEKETLAKVIGKALYAKLQDKSLGELLHVFAVSDAEIYDLFPLAAMRYRDRKRDPAAFAERLSDEESVEDFDLFAVLSLDEPDKKEEKPGLADDEAGFYASFIESKWVERLRRLAEDHALQVYFGLKGAIFNNLATELATGAARLGLRQALAEQFRRIAAYGNTSRESVARRQAVVAARYLNNYIDRLNFNPDGEADEAREATLFSGKTVKIFAPESPVGDLPELSEKPVDFSRKWLSYWLLALENLMMDNVNFDGQGNINFAENSVLADILRRISRELDA